MMKRNRLINFPISEGNFSTFIDQIISLPKDKKSSYVCVANVHMFVEAYNDKEFLNAIENADIITPDGVPLTWGLKILYGIKQVRVAGMDLLPKLLVTIADKKLSVYFYGGSDLLLIKTKEYLSTKLPSLQIAGFYSPPFRELSNKENDEVIVKINKSGANFVIVVLGCPKQEIWMASMKHKINCCMIGIGGALPVFAGLQKRAPMWMQKYGLEWLYRFVNEPKRLFKRYFSTNVIFIYLMVKEYIVLKLFRK